MEQSTFFGWQTWNVYSVLSHVFMPSGLALSLGIKEYKDGGYLREALIGRQNRGAEEVFPLAHGSNYTSLRLRWRGIELLIESAQDASRFVLLVTPIREQFHPSMLVLECGFLWRRPGVIAIERDNLRADGAEKTVCIRCVGAIAEEDLNLPASSPYLTRSTRSPAAFYTGDPLSLAQAQVFVREQREAYDASLATCGETAPLHEAIQCAVRWDTIYDAAHQRVLSPVSRIWSIAQGGYVLFCWDTFFVAALAALFDPALAIANLEGIIAERVAEGFVPNFVNGAGVCSLDRSQPPVGSAMTLMICRRLKDPGVARRFYAALLEWNAWFFENRSHPSGALGWGSNPYTPVRDNYWEHEGVNDRYGAALESGLDNSPMYDDIPFDFQRHMLCMEDVGLTGLFMAFDIDGEQILSVYNKHPYVQWIALDLDRCIFHRNFNNDKLRKLEQEDPPRVELEKDWSAEEWFVVRSAREGVSAREVCREAGMEELRAYKRRSRESIDQMRP